MLQLALSDLFEEKEESEIEALMKAADEELNAGETAESFEYSNLFIEVRLVVRSWSHDVITCMLCN